MLDNRTQNMGIGIGNEDRHGCRERAYEGDAYVAPGKTRRLCGTERGILGFTLQAQPLLLSCPSGHAAPRREYFLWVVLTNEDVRMRPIIIVHPCDRNTVTRKDFFKGH